jgi:hypothetical protein
MSKGNSFRTGQKVAWNWGQGTATGKVRERFEREVKRTLKGSEITRRGSADDPAYLLRQEDGDEVLKLGSELRQTN